MSEVFGGEREGARIKVVGVGGGGGNAVNTMIQSGMSDVDFISANTDAQALAANLAPTRIQLGNAFTKGLGAGANPEIGKQAASEDIESLKAILDGADMVFVTAGMGGGTGTGGAPVIARAAKELGALTVGVVTKPFVFEGKRRMRQAEDGIRELRDSVDTLITIPNQRLLSVSSRNMPILETFRKADDVLLQAVRGISDLIRIDGVINLDFADVRTIMSEMGMAMMGAATADGENRAVEAAQRAISSPLLDDISIQGARGVLINVTGGTDLSLHEVNEAATLIQEEAHEDANIIFGAVLDEAMEDKLRITVIATGFGDSLSDQLPVDTFAPPTRPDLRRGAGPTVVQGGGGARAERFDSSGRRVVRMGVIEDGAEPVWHKSDADAPQGNDEEEYDIPTFLRKSAE